MQLTQLWPWWQELVLSCALGFAGRIGEARFLQWVTGIVLNVEEHTITQSLVALDSPADWKALESFAETGTWDLSLLHLALTDTVAPPEDRLWFGFQVWAADDTLVHRSSPDVWGTCTFTHRSGRCPNRSRTVRAHNWVLLGALHRLDEQPPLFLPSWAELYFRQSQMPSAQAGPDILFRTKPQILVAGLEQTTKSLPGKHLAVVDGGYCHASFLVPLAAPSPGPDGQKPARIEVVTRIRHDAALYLPLQVQPGERRPGRPRKWGPRLGSPDEADTWPEAWQEMQVFLYGRWRQVRYKEVICRWRPLGSDLAVKVVVACVEGFQERFTLLSTATELSGSQILEIFAGRSRIEDGIRDLKQRLGWEELRCWTRRPIERTTWVLLTALTCMKLLAEKVSEAVGDDWWLHPPWKKEKQRPSVLDVQRLLWQHRQEFQRGLAEQLDRAKTGPPGRGSSQ